MDVAGAALLGGSEAHVYDPDSGEWINEKFQRIAELINKFNDELFLVWIPYSERDPSNAKPYAVVHFPRDKQPYPIMVKSEDEIDERIIRDLFRMNQEHHDFQTEMDAANMAAELVKMQEAADRKAERRERHLSILKSPLHRYSLGNGRYIE